MEIIAKVINYFSKSYTSVLVTLVHWSANFKGVTRPNMKDPAVETKLIAKAVLSPKEEWPEDMTFSSFLPYYTPHPLSQRK